MLHSLLTTIWMFTVCSNHVFMVWCDYKEGLCATDTLTYQRKQRAGTMTTQTDTQTEFLHRYPGIKCRWFSNIWWLMIFVVGVTKSLVQMHASWPGRCIMSWYDVAVQKLGFPTIELFVKVRGLKGNNCLYHIQLNRRGRIGWAICLFFYFTL